MKRITQLFTLLPKKITLAFLLVFSLIGLHAQNVANFQLDKLGDNLFQMSIIPDTTFTSPGNTVSAMQMIVKVQTGGFVVNNLNNLVGGVVFANSSRNDAPIENPSFDYLSFSLQSGATNAIPFVAGQAVPLFTFQNGGVCSTDSLYLIQPVDPFYPPNTINANAQHQLTVLGYGSPDAPVGATGANVADCTDNCVAEYEIEKLTNGAFQVSLTPRETYDGTGSNNRISNLQVTIKVKSDGFQAGNIINLINTGLSSEVRFDQTSRFEAPLENPAYDYISFNLQNTSTDQIPFEAGLKVPLFTFNNTGFCTEDTVSLISRADPFYPPNTGGQNADQQLTILGYGSSDAPICVIGKGTADCTKDCFLGCNDNVQVSLGVNCVAEVLPEMIATATNLTCPNGPKGIEILDNNGNVLPTSPFLNESHIGQTFQVRVIDSITTNSCWGSIIVKDKTPPIIDCQNDTLTCAAQDISPDAIGYPIVTDNCSDTVANLTYTDRQILNGCGTEFSGRIERTWTAVDSAGMVGTCIQNIYFLRQSLDSVMFPINRDGLEGPIVSCSNVATDPADVGSPTINGNAIYPSIIGFCQLNAGFRDDSVSFCQGNIQIVRTWTVVNTCSGDFRTDVQIISVVDTTGPAFISPDTIRATVDPGMCTSTVTFPEVFPKDECSMPSVTISTDFGNLDSNGGTIGWIPIGYHEVVYTAIDDCNNRTAQTAILHVQDRTPPVAACDFINDVALRPNGTVDVDASVFDDGSRDGCSGNQVTFLVQRVGDTLDFADFVTFYCTDAGDTVDVNLRVTDLSGNIDECVARIVITNDSPPAITCPADRTIQCTDDYSDLNIFGVPTILDDCGGATNYTEQDSFEINNCGVGRIIRTFNVAYGSNNISCQQIITVENNSTFDGNTIDWPDDYLAFACDNAPLSPDDLPDGFNVPTYDSIGNLCSRILRYHNDAEFDDVTTPVGCYTILRTWSIIDWCVFNPNDTTAGGYWSHVQTIDLVNTVPPIFTDCPADFTVDINTTACDVEVPLVVTGSDDCSPVLSYSYTIDLNDNGTTDMTGSTNDATATYPVGTHRAAFLVTDDCGNTTACNFTFTVRDNVAPIAVCNTDTFNIVDIGDEFAAVIDPRLLALGSTDNCSSFDNLTITATPSSFSCSQEGLNQVTVTVADMEGNSTNCIVDVYISDTNNRCPNNRTGVNISGIITNEKGQRVEQVAVTINHPDVAPTMTNTKGEFNLKDVPVGNDYTILPTRDFDIMNGISTFDLVLISRHILGIETINSPYRLIAADVNKSGSISAYDIVQLRQLILRMRTDFPDNNAWRFVRMDYEFEHPTDPNSNYFPEVYNINDLPKIDMDIEGFVAVKVGDVNSSANTLAAFAEGESRNATDQLQLTVTDQQLIAGTTVEVPVKASNFEQLLGFQFALDFDVNQLELVAIEPAEQLPLGEHNFGLDFVERGLITTSWNQPDLFDTQQDHQSVFTLKFKVKATTTLSEALTIDREFMKVEAYAASESRLADLWDVALIFENKAPANQFKLYQNRPNPFSNNAIIGFELNQAETVNFQILDITGKVMKQEMIDAKVGYNELIVSQKDLKGKGIYYYQLATATGIQTKKMIVVE